MRVARHEPPSVLLVGDAAGVEHALRAAVPGVTVAHAPDYFHAIAHLGSTPGYDAVIAPVAPIRNRAEAAISHLRATAGAARLLLVSDAGGEILSRRLIGQDGQGRTGADDYLVWPVQSAELLAALEPEAAPTLALNPAVPAVSASSPADLPIAEIVLDALVREPGDALTAALDEINRQLPRGARLILARSADRAPFCAHNSALNSRPIGTRSLHLISPREFPGAEGLIENVAAQLSRACDLQQRHAGLQKLAITDDLTGLYNLRYFKHGLARILARAKASKNPVTLLLFDIDGFKKYNDQFGHAAGDEILRQTGKMMKRCVRDHDLVARLGGDEFAVVFWDHEAPRPPRPTKPGEQPGPSKPPTSPQLVFERFRKLVASHDFQALGPSGQGALTISGGLAVYPFDATTPDDLIRAADEALMFGAKKSGKNMLHLVGPEKETPLPGA